MLVDSAFHLAVWLETEQFQDFLFPKLGSFVVNLAVELYDGRTDTSEASRHSDLLVRAAGLFLHEDGAAQKLSLLRAMAVDLPPPWVWEKGW